MTMLDVSFYLKGEDHTKADPSAYGEG